MITRISGTLPSVQLYSHGTVLLEPSRWSRASSETKDEKVTMIMSRLIFAVGTAPSRCLSAVQDAVNGPNDSDGGPSCPFFSCCTHPANHIVRKRTVANAITIYSRSRDVSVQGPWAINWPYSGWRSPLSPRVCAFTHYLSTPLPLAPVCLKRSIWRKKVSVRTRSIARRYATCAIRQRHIRKTKRWMSIANLKPRFQVPSPRRWRIIYMLRMTSLMAVCVHG